MGTADLYSEFMTYQLHSSRKHLHRSLPKIDT